MHCDIQNLADFKRLLLNDEIEEARKIFASKQNTFKKEVKTPSALKDLPHDDFATYLIPVDVNRAKGHRLFALKATPNGDCLFNVVSILLCGNESNSMLLRLLVAGELYFNAPFYANHSVFTNTTRVCTDLTLETLFSIALTKAGDEKMSETGNKLDPVKAEALVACTPGKWSSFMHVLGLASVISNPVCSIYPDVNFRFRSLIHRCVSPRSCPTLDQPCGIKNHSVFSGQEMAILITAPGPGLNQTISCRSSARARGRMSINYLPNKEKRLPLERNNKGRFFPLYRQNQSLNLVQIISALRALKVQCLVIKEMPRPLNSVETLSPT